MKALTFFLSLFFFISCSGQTKRTFTGSTPAGKEVRHFLNIPLTDSIDFIRWKLVLEEDRFEMVCNYGIGKPNTNGFYNGGKQFTTEGKTEKKWSHYRLFNGPSVLNITELNENLLHLADGGTKLLKGNSGWSYTLNNSAPLVSRAFILTDIPPYIGDSLVYTGRTPCKIPGLGVSPDCYKLKWKIVLYPAPGKNTPGRYIVYGTNWRKENLQGTWEFTGPKDRLGYVLKDENGKDLIYLVKLGDLVFFTDVKGNFLVGDEDFSYTLNQL